MRVPWWNRNGCAARRRTGDFQIDFPSVTGKAAGNSLRPLNDRKIGLFERLLRAKFQKLVVVPNAIDIVMVKQLLSTMDLAKDKRGARHIAWIEAKLGRDRLNQSRFTGSQCAIERNDGVRRQVRGQQLAQRIGTRQTIDIEHHLVHESAPC